MLLAVGCGPVVPLSQGGSGSTSEDAGGLETTTIIMGSTSLPPSPGDASSSSVDGDSSGEPFACPPLPTVPPGEEASWCDGDPSATGGGASAYVGCLDGFVHFRQSWLDEEHSYLFYDASAQFYTVTEDASGEAFSTVLDPYDGTLDDCALYEQGGDNQLGEFEFVDENGMTFTFGDFQVEAERFTSGSVISYSAPAAEQGLLPQHLAPHGFILANGQGNSSDAVTLADPIVATSPAMDGTGVLDRRVLSITWEPSAIGIPLELRLQINENDEPRYTLLCRVQDDGEFTVPEALACHLPSDENAFLILARTDRAIVTTEDGRTIGVLIESSVRSSVVLE